MGFKKFKRPRNYLSESNVKKVAESIYMSKARYGLQLMGKIRWSEEDTQNRKFSRNY